MKISQKTEYALAALLESPHALKDLVKVSGIAERRGIPLKFLELIMGTLKQAGFVETRREREGGYRLARPASQITVGEVLTCLETSGNGKRTTVDAFTDMWSPIDKSISTVVDHTTFAELVARWQRSAS